MMQNYKLTIQYDGTRYDGWQRQGNTGNTIQGKLEHVLGELTGHKTEIHGAGRTDAGVHARAQIAHCKIAITQTPDELRAYLNRYLPADIACTGCETAPERFHARLNATGKRYVYRLWTGENKNVFERRYLCAWETPLALAPMRAAAALLTGTHDFRAFCSLKRMKKSTVRTLSRLDIERHGDEMRLIFEGDGFLYNMVRILAGTLVEVGEGRRAADAMPSILASLDRQQAGQTLPPHGLLLDEVFYAQQKARG